MLLYTMAGFVRVRRPGRKWCCLKCGVVSFVRAFPGQTLVRRMSPFSTTSSSMNEPGRFAFGHVDTPLFALSLSAIQILCQKSILRSAVSSHDLNVRGCIELTQDPSS